MSISHAEGTDGDYLISADIYDGSVFEDNVSIDISSWCTSYPDGWGLSSISYSLNNGSTWTKATDFDPYYRWNQITLENLKPNTKYNILIRAKFTVGPTITTKTALTVTTYAYPYCSKSPDFIIGQPVTLEFYNPLGRTFNFNIDANGVRLSYTWTVKGITTHTGVYSENMQSQLYASIPNSPSGEYKVIVTYDGNVTTRNNHNKYSVDTELCRPTFTNFEYHDGLSKTVNVTGNNQVLVKGYSNLIVTIPAEYKMVAKNGATPKEYVVSVSTINKNKAYGESDVEISVGALNTTGTIRLSVTAYDSRGVYTVVNKDIVVYDYKKPVLNVEGKRLNNFETETTFKSKGEYSQIIINNVAKNRVTKVQYRYRETGGTWSDWGTVSTTLTSGKFTCSDIVLIFDRDKTYECEVQAIDLLDYTSVVVPIDKGQAVFFISSNKYACYINGEIITPYPVGSVIITGTNTNPSATYGGTWELKNKGFISKGDGGANYFTASSDITSYTCYFVRNGKSIRIRLYFTPTVDITDTGLEIGTLNLNAMGVERFNINYFDILGGSDGGNCACMFRVASNGVVTVTDIVGLSTFPKGQACYLDFTTPLTTSRMLDNACDEFYWLRTN